jgi:hypothetical protein
LAVKNTDRLHLIFYIYNIFPIVNTRLAIHNLCAGVLSSPSV